MRNKKKTHQQICATRPVLGQSRKFVYVYMFFFPWGCVSSCMATPNPGVRVLTLVCLVCHFNLGVFEAPWRIASVGHPQTCVHLYVWLGIDNVSDRAPLAGRGI